ncbi:unnamed protein product, partial [Rotaria magnacalcarata]
MNYMEGKIYISISTQCLSYFYFFFCRYKDQLFFTWNNSNEKELCRFLRPLQDKYPSVQFQPRIGSTVRFFNVHIDNSKGELSTRIYHQSMMG